MICFTTAANRDIPAARVLFGSIRQFHPDWRFFIVLTEPPAASLRAFHHADEIVQLGDLGIDNLDTWVFMHGEMEARLAIKAYAITHLLQREPDARILFLDKSSFVFGSLAALNDLLDQHSICLVPHFTTPAMGRREILRQEISVLREGSFDLAFLALRPDEQGMAFSRWWGSRLQNDCYQNDERGIFFDQKWCNMAPVLFDNLHILRDPAYNLSLRNLQGEVQRTSDGLRANGRPVKIFRFLPLERRDDFGVTDEDPGLDQLYSWYAAELAAHDPESLSSLEWSLGSFDNGKPISHAMRWIYRRRPDLRRRYPHPFRTGQGESVYDHFAALERRGSTS